MEPQKVKIHILQDNLCLKHNQTNFQNHDTRDYLVTALEWKPLFLGQCNVCTQNIIITPVSLSSKCPFSPNWCYYRHFHFKDPSCQTRGNRKVPLFKMAAKSNGKWINFDNVICTT